ncbi:hypothetical protein CK227_16030 [Mesorhizobium sp. WSM4308]|nr:hypothetical protein CK232_20035 [Mesorhizobium sp. WSM4304]PBB74204.1 hypothetical protein CK227_16030 [Mesorhizobium sp. WSM4308]
MMDVASTMVKFNLKGVVDGIGTAISGCTSAHREEKRSACEKSQVQPSSTKKCAVREMAFLMLRLRMWSGL